MKACNQRELIPLRHSSMAAFSNTSNSPLGSTGTTQRGLLIISSSRASSAVGNTVSSPSPGASSFVPSPCPVSSCCTGCCGASTSGGDTVAGCVGTSCTSALVLGVGDNCWSGDCWGDGGGCWGTPGCCCCPWPWPLTTGASAGESPAPAGLPRIEIVILGGGSGQIMPPSFHRLRAIWVGEPGGTTASA